MLGRGEHPIRIHRPQGDHAEHESEDIWSAVCAAVRAAIAVAGIDPSVVRGLAFDATCSLVLRDREGQPLTVSLGGEAARDTIVWLDHRAIGEADECTASGHHLLDRVGGAMSPEMQLPKLMWLKRNLPQSWSKAGYLFDLADFLAWKASGATARSRCTLTCKWAYRDEAGGWPLDLLETLGLTDLIERGGLPQETAAPGADLGPLTADAAAALGLTTACRVAAGFIDAYAGALGVLGSLPDAEIERHAALVAGTSSCVMAFASHALPIPGGWGPYFAPVLADRWMIEGGQSAAGALLDHVIRIHGGGLEPNAENHRRIVERIAALRRIEGRDLAPRLHVLPDFHGNRSPLADPHALGAVTGLPLDASFDALCRLYFRAAVSIALGVRNIVDAMNAAGYAISTLHVTGGHVRNPLLMELYADATGCAVTEPADEDAVLVGTAAAAAAAAGLHADLRAAALAMGRPGRLRRGDPAARARYDRDYRVFLAMQRQRAEIDALVEGA